MIEGPRTVPNLLLAAVAWYVSAGSARAEWPQFRGPRSAGVSGAKDLPVTWSAGENLQWKQALPGYGASSPVVVGKEVFVTCYSGYGLDAEEPGNQERLRLQLLSFDLETGRKVWETSIDPVLPDQEYQRFLPEHGYASATPASDGETIYAFFGKSGLHAYDLEERKLLWSASAGGDTHVFGSAASPLLAGELVIVNACPESGAVIAFEKRTGKEAWRVEGIKESWSTPVLVEAPGGGREVVVSMEGAVLGLDPRTGERLWSVEGIDDYVCPAVVWHEGIVYALGGRHSTKSLAVRAGGRGEVTESRRLWKSGEGSKVPSPVYHDGHLYFADHTGIAVCIDAKTGERVYRERLGGKSHKTYASAVLVDGRIYYVTCHGGTFVVALKPEFEEIAHNVLGDESTFNASPAVAPGKLILRSDRFLYCIGKSAGGS